MIAKLKDFLEDLVWGDYLETLNWDKTPPAPALPPEIIARSQQKYQQLRDILLG